MLHQISWQTYMLTVLFSVVVYYTLVGLGYYRSEFVGLRNRFTGRQQNFHTGTGQGFFGASTYSIMGASAEPGTDSTEDLLFAPSDNPDDTEPGGQPAAKDSRQIGAFSEMISEVKTLVRVIGESGETRENFEMLFKLVIQKYNTLAGTDYQRKVNEFLLNESKGQFPFPLNTDELNNYWTNY